MSTPPGVTSTPLPHISAPCPKCGSESRSLVWIPPAGDLRAIDHHAGATGDPREHMRVTCGTCGYAWAAAPLDASGSAEGDAP